MQIQAYKPSDAGNLTTWAADINAAHIEAMRHMERAVGHAKRAGELLLKVKQKLPHGEFGPWLEANCSVSERQARRYMAEAQGKLPPVREVKSDTVSVLPAPTQKPKLTIVAPPAVEPEIEAPPDYSELDAAYDQITGLQADLVVARMGDIPEEEKQQAAALLAEKDAYIKTLEATNRALVLSRDSLMEETSQMKRQMAMQRREIDKLKATGHPAGTH